MCSFLGNHCKQAFTLFYATTSTTPLATHRVKQKLQKEQISYEELEAKYNKRTSVLSRTLVFLLIPIFTVLFYGLFFKKKKFLSFNLLLLGVMLPVATVVLVRSFKGLNIPAVYVTNDAVASNVLQVCFGVYLFMMLNDAEAILRHQQVVWWSYGFSDCLVFFHIVWLYRFLLFEATLSIV